MLLFSAKNKVADEVSCVVWMDGAALLSTDACIVPRALRYNLLLLILLPTLAYRILTTDKPICRGLHIVVASHHSIPVDDCRWYKVELQERLTIGIPRIFDNTSKI